MKKIKISFIILSIFLFNFCDELDVNDDIDSKRAEIIAISDALYNGWFLAAHSSYGPGQNLWIASDAGTNSYGSSTTDFFMGIEPREVLNNSSSYTNADIIETFYLAMYDAIYFSNKVIKGINIDGLKIITNDQTDLTYVINAVAYFVRGISHGYLGLIYDQAFVVTETSEYTKTPSPYTDIIAAALTDLDKAIEICENNTFDVPAEWFGGVTLNQSTLKQVINSYAARILAYSPRNSSENESIDWLKVYNYASNGIDFDFSPIGDIEPWENTAGVDWYSQYHTYSNYTDRGRADMRIVNMMDPDMPNRWPGENGYSLLPEPKINTADVYDNRLISDFEYLSECNYLPERGYYFFSCYRFKRRDQYLLTWMEPMPEMYKAENDLILAEAALKTSKQSEAVTIINNGTRVTRGGLPSVSNDDTEIEDAIFHERNIELFCSGMGIEYFTMRKADKLQYGTPLHLPIPGSQLNILGINYYSFGGETGIPGVDYSIGGWED